MPVRTKPSLPRAQVPGAKPPRESAKAVLWVRSPAAWYRLLAPRAAYRALHEAFVARVFMGEVMASFVRHSPHTSNQKLYEHVVSRAQVASQPL